jgi:hypothetical protein
VDGGDAGDRAAEDRPEGEEQQREQDEVHRVVAHEPQGGDGEEVDDGPEHAGRALVAAPPAEPVPADDAVDDVRDLGRLVVEQGREDADAVDRLGLSVRLVRRAVGGGDVAAVGLVGRAAVARA